MLKLKTYSFFPDAILHTAGYPPWKAVNRMAHLRHKKTTWTSPATWKSSDHLLASVSFPIDPYQNFARIADPHKRNRNIRGNQQQTLEYLTDKERDVQTIGKERLMFPSFIAVSRTKGQYTMDINACHNQVGAVLLQKPPDVPPKPIGYWSRLLHKLNARTTRRSANASPFYGHLCSCTRLLKQAYSPSARITPLLDAPLILLMQQEI